MKLLSFLFLFSLSTITLSQSKTVSLVGKWEAKAAQGYSVIYNFKDAKHVEYSFQVPGAELSGTRVTRGKYKIDTSKPIWQIDIYELNDTSQRPKDARFLGIFELLKNGKMKLEGVSSVVGKRPTKFTGKAHIFTKIK